MKGIGVVMAVLAICAAEVATAAPERSLRPMPRPEGDASPAMEALIAAQAVSAARVIPDVLRPLARPGERPVAAVLVVPADPAATNAEPAPAPAPETALAPKGPRPVARPAWAAARIYDPLAVAPTSDDLAANLPQPEPAALVMGQTVSLRPNLRPEGMVQRAMAKRRQENQELRRGAICGDVAIQGEEIGPVPGRISGCGVLQAVRVRSVSGVTLSTAATMDCTTAKALKTWVGRASKAVGSYSGGLGQLQVAAHYACRTRNNQSGGRISEHGKGRAIDISAVRTNTGAELSVLRDWGSGTEGRILRDMHQAACGPFGTVLGPNADRFHRDHFHFDTARYRSGSYCK